MPLRSWRERLATPLASVAPSAAPVSSVATLPRSRLEQIGPNTWQEAEWCRGLCVRDGNPLAEGDLIWCTSCRAQADSMRMPWDLQP